MNQDSRVGLELIVAYVDLGRCPGEAVLEKLSLEQRGIRE